MIEKLKPCPFCGSKDVVLRPGIIHSGAIHCNNCTADVVFNAVMNFMGANWEETTVTGWNKRVELTNLELDEKLQKKYDEGFMDGQDYAVSVM